ncbi:DUF5686 family protein, partial [Chitinophagales bacterium]|nr:DUF5686 family protein [Chitinophagales bacterium]
LAFTVNGTFVGIYSNYKTKKEFPKKFFSKEVVAVANDALEKEAEYWIKNRPLPLTAAEGVDYHKKDSIKLVKKTPAYQDSLDRKNNKFHLLKLLLIGYRYTKTSKEYAIAFPTLPKAISFNAVEGTALDLDFNFRKQLSDKKRYYIKPGLRLGWASRTALPKFTARYFYDNYTNASIGFSIGHYHSDLDNRNVHPAVINSFYSLLARSPKLKLYSRKLIRIWHEQEIVNGLQLKSSLHYEERDPLSNSSQFSWFGNKSELYPSNNPELFPIQESERSFIVSTEAEITFDQKYERLPNEKFRYTSDYPVVTIAVKAGIPTLKAASDFIAAEISVVDNLDFKRIGRLDYRLVAGDYFRSEQLSYPDVKQFNGNQTIISNDPMQFFQAHDLYSKATSGRYFEWHTAHHFGGLISNQIPGFRNLQWRFVAGFNGYLAEGLDHHMEYSIGLENILKLFQVDFTQSLTSDHWGIRITVPFGL